jgi:uncharacterized protein HemX
MDANEPESRTPEETDPLRAYALQNAAKEVKPKPSSVMPFLISVVVTAVILAIAFYLWGR